ncbi:cytochrome C, partial [Nocardiopsis dassonvillei]|nr:cytochrome C [Nocardiopsis dassonvillei]
IFDLDRVGQVAEGLIGWVVGLSLIIACAIWITAKQRAHD